MLTGMVVQFDQMQPPALAQALAVVGRERGAGLDGGCSVLAIAKLKCLPYLQRTFGVRNLLRLLLDQGAAAYLDGVERFLRVWQVPAEHGSRVIELLTGWAREVQLMSAAERETMRTGSYLEKLEPYLDRGCAAVDDRRSVLSHFCLLLINLTGEPLPTHCLETYAFGLVPIGNGNGRPPRSGTAMLLDAPPGHRRVARRKVRMLPPPT